MNMKYKNQGFTLIELLLVFAIILLLSSIVLASVSTARIKANDAKIKEDLRQVKNALEIYYTKHYSYPPTTATRNTEYTYKPIFKWLSITGIKIADASGHTNP